VIELVGLKPDVILVSTALVLQPLRQETRSIPIVFTQIGEPVQNGFVASLAQLRPQGRRDHHPASPFAGDGAG
jgi:ABC-type uncharacterized transport system substrate-binding protein